VQPINHAAEFLVTLAREFHCLGVLFFSFFDKSFVEVQLSLNGGGPCDAPSVYALCFGQDSCPPRINILLLLRHGGNDE